MKSDGKVLLEKLRFREYLDTRRDLRALELAVAGRLVSLFNHERGYAYPSLDSLAADLGASRSKVAAAVKRLVELGLFAVEPGGGRGKANEYRPSFGLVPDGCPYRAAREKAKPTPSENSPPIGDGLAPSEGSDREPETVPQIVETVPQTGLNRPPVGDPNRTKSDSNTTVLLPERGRRDRERGAGFQDDLERLIAELEQAPGQGLAKLEKALRKDAAGQMPFDVARRLRSKLQEIVASALSDANHGRALRLLNALDRSWGIPSPDRPRSGPRGGIVATIRRLKAMGDQIEEDKDTSDWPF